MPIHTTEPTLNLYLLTRTDNWSYDDHDSVVVAATSADDAKTIGPDNQVMPNNESWSSWAKSLDDIKCQLIGTAIPGTKRGVILASFNAG